MTSEEVARELIRIGAVELRTNPAEWFTWTSGRRAPIYCDNRLVMSHPELRGRIADALADAVRAAWPHAEVIAGTATAGIAPATWVSERLGLPMVYVRGSAKAHGQERRIEGCALAGESVVVIEDLISTGGSSGTAVQTLRDGGGKVIGVQAIFAYGLPSAEARFRELGVPWQALTSYDVLLGAQSLDAEALRVLREWQTG